MYEGEANMEWLPLRKIRFHKVNLSIYLWLWINADGRATETVARNISGPKQQQVRLPSILKCPQLLVKVKAWLVEIFIEPIVNAARRPILGLRTRGAMTCEGPAQRIALGNPREWMNPPQFFYYKAYFKPSDSKDS